MEAIGKENQIFINEYKETPEESSMFNFMITSLFRMKST